VLVLLFSGAISWVFALLSGLFDTLMFQFACAKYRVGSGPESEDGDLGALSLWYSQVSRALAINDPDIHLQAIPLCVMAGNFYAKALSKDFPKDPNRDELTRSKIQDVFTVLLDAATMDPIGFHESLKDYESFMAIFQESLTQAGLWGKHLGDMDKLLAVARGHDGGAESDPEDDG